MTRAAVACLCLLFVAPIGTARAAESRGAEQARLQRLERQLDALDETLQDDEVAMAEFTLFDECMFLVGASSHGGYRFGAHGLRSALSLDLDGAGLPDFAFLAFPAEEPPGIECNEDAGPEVTDEG